MIRGLVIFNNTTGIWWLKFLKPGFRHCFLILKTEDGALWVDPLSSGIGLETLKTHEIDTLAGWYRHQGMQVLSFEVEPKLNKPFSWAPMTCVEVIKRILGLRGWHIVTPWQLYNHIKNIT